MPVFLGPLSGALHSSHVQLEGEPVGGSELSQNSKRCQTNLASSEESGHWISLESQGRAVPASPSAPLPPGLIPPWGCP